MSKVPIPDSYWLLEEHLLAGEYPGHLNKDDAKKKLRKILAAGIRSFIDLTETTDPLEPYDEVLRTIAAEERLDVRYRRIPVRDMWIPHETLMAEILDLIESEIASGRPVYLHCWGGIGRTGTVAGCWLVEQGLSCDDALTRIMQLRVLTPDGWKDSPQTPEQKSFVRAWRARPVKRTPGRG